MSKLESNCLKYLGNKIKEIRNRKGISQFDLAVLMQTDQAYISKVESGLKDVRLSWLVKLAIALEVGTDFFVPSASDIEKMK